MTDYRELREAATFKEYIVENSVMELRSTTILSLLDALAAAEAREKLLAEGAGNTQRALIKGHHEDMAAARNDALEEAANVADENASLCLHGRNPVSVKSKISAAIRALKVKP